MIWRAIFARPIPHCHSHLTFRSLVQIKSHAQKVVKRQEAGEDIFQKLEEVGPQFMDSLVLQASRERDLLRAAGVNVNTTRPSKSLLDAGGAAPSSGGGTGGPESVIAAAALCQLSTVGTQQQWDQLDPLDVMPMVNQQANV